MSINEIPIYGLIIIGITFFGGIILCIWGYFHAEKMVKEEEKRKNHTHFYFW
jgi:hypothetical protein